MVWSQNIPVLIIDASGGKFEKVFRVCLGCMKQQAISVLLQAYFELQRTAFKLYEESDTFFERGDLLEAGIIQGIADKIYEEAENLDIFITEMES